MRPTIGKGRLNVDDSCVSCRCRPGRVGDVCPCSGHPKRRKRQEHAGGRNCSRSAGNGERVAIVEADPQGTISKWKERRGHPDPRVVRVADPAEIEGALVSLEAEGIWLTVIDTAATNNALAMHAIARANLCLIPVRPSPADIEAAIPTLVAIRRLNRRFAFVLAQTPPRGCRVSEAAASLNSLGVLALPYVGQRNDHQDALGAGLGVTEFAQEGRASEGVRELWRWILKKLGEGSRS
ncbi:chromosome partitioning protein [Bradyrhizobium ottawaense]|uniref:ParA family protein n=1 Tax=Bradyrhizobium ottawaense TaxID=931866 RepID=UPI0038385FD1